MNVRNVLLLAPCCGVLLALAAVAQPPGHSIATVSVRNAPGEMYDVDHQAGAVTQLVLSAQLAAERPNCVLMLAPGFGLVGTNPKAATSANVYTISVQNGVVIETVANATPTAGLNVAQLVLFGARVYFTTQDVAGNAGVLQSLPVGGGPVTRELDLSSVGVLGLANAVATLGGKVYVATFDSGPAASAVTPGELVEYDPATRQGRIVMNLPAGGFAPLGNPWNTGIVNMRADPQTPSLLVLQGVYGELLHIDPAAASVVRQVWTGLFNAGGNALASGSTNSFDWDPVAEDWIVGTRDGHVERWVDGQQAEAKIPGLGSSTVATENGVTGIHHFAAASGRDVSYGGGCAGNAGWTPTDSSFGAPQAGNRSFRLGLFAADAGDAAVLVVDLQNLSIGGVPLPLDLGLIGAPGCLLRTGILVTVPVPVTGAGPGLGQAVVPLPIPANAIGAGLFRQWLVLQANPTNGAGVVVSNARQIVVQ